MSIEITGPRSYDFQYLLSLYFLLKNLDNVDISFFIEKTGSEDCELIYGNPKKSIEIQIKSEKSIIDEFKFAKWLCHYKSHSSSDCILNRLISDDNKFFVIITSGRCSDATKDFISEDMEIRENKNIDKNIKDTIIKSIDKFGTGSVTHLEKERGKNNKKIAKLLKSKKAFETLASKVSIWEKVNKESIEFEVKKILNEKHSIPQANTSNVILKLLKVIKEEGRDNQKDISVPILNTINFFKGCAPEISVSDYILRGDEESLIKSLSENRYLLLNGASLCGKSQTAKYIAIKFFNLGYRYYHTDEINDATRFINNPNQSENRICLLEDPFGHYVNESIVTDDRWLKLTNLLQNVPCGRLIMVTSNKEVTNAISTFQGVKWLDLTVTNKTFTLDLWERICNSKNVPLQIREKVQEHILGVAISPQPGHLKHLANNYESIESYQEEALRHFYMIDAIKISNYIKGKGREYQKVYCALGLVGNTIVYVTRPILAYVLSDSPDAIGFRSENDTITISNFKKKANRIQFPEYPTEKKLSDEQQNILDNFQDNGFLVFDTTANAYVFSHPIHYEAAKLLMKKASIGRFEELCNQLQKAIGSLSVANSSVAVKRLEFIFTEYSGQVSYREKIILIARAGLSSIFPAVSDLCFSFLSRILKQLPTDLTDKIKENLAKRSNDIAYVYWQNGVPYIPNTGEVPLVKWQANMKLIDQDKYEYIKSKFLDKTVNISSEEAWRLAYAIEQFSRKQRISVSKEVLIRLMSFNEVFIREIASFHMMWLYNEPNTKLTQLAFGDEHPSVQLEAIKGCIRGWHWYDEETRKTLHDQIISTFKKEEVKLISTHFMMQFGIGYSGLSFDWRDDIQPEAVPSMWKIWGDLLPAFFDNFPTYIHYNEGRFWSTMKDSVKYISEQQAVNIITSWYQWLLRYVNERGSYKAFLAVTDYVFLFKFGDIIKRESLSLMILSNDDELFKAYNSRIFVTNWHNLTTKERNTFIGIIKRDKALLAVVITSKDINNDILNALEISTFHNKTIEQIISNTPNELLLNCISVLYVSPYYSLLDNYYLFPWSDLVEFYIDKNHIFFSKVAIRELLEDVLNNYGRRQYCTWKNSLNVFKNTISGANDGIIQFTFDFLLRYFSYSHKHMDCSEYAEFFFNNLKAKTLKKFKNKILKNLETINNQEVLVFLDKVLFENKILSYFPKDLLILNKLKSLDKKSSIEITKIVKFIEKTIKNDEIKLLLTYDCINEWVHKSVIKDKKIAKTLYNSRKGKLEFSDLTREKINVKYESHFKSFYVNKNEINDEL